MSKNIRNVCYTSTSAPNEAAYYALQVPKSSHSSDLDTFWGRLCDAWRERHKTKATQQAVASQYGMTQPAVGEYVKGGVPRMAKATEIARDLRVCVEWLLTGRGPRKPSEQMIDPYFQAVFDIIAQFPEFERVRTLEYLQFKLDHAKRGWPASTEEALRSLTDTGKFRKPQ